MYCHSCKKHTINKNIKPKVTKNNKPYIFANVVFGEKIIKIRFY